MVMPSEPESSSDVITGRPSRLSQKDDRAAYGLAVTRAIKDNISPDEITAALQDALHARVYDRLGRDVGPDHRTCLKAVEIYLNHTVGLPVQRVETSGVKATGSDSDILERILNNPSARKTLAKLLKSYETTPI